MSRVTFKRIASDQANIYDEDGDCVGEVFRHPDILNAGQFYFLVWLHDDPRSYVRVHDRSRIRDVTEERLASHPYL